MSPTISNRERAAAKDLLKAGKLAEAIAAAQEELAERPGDVDAMYCRAVAERYLGRFDDALATLQSLKSVDPAFARAYQEEGHTRRLMGDLDGARSAYQQAVGRNRALPAAWRELAAIHDQQGDRQGHAVAKAEYERLARLPAELVTVASLIQEKRLYKAERLCRDFLLRNPHHGEAMRLLATLAMKLFVYDDAEFLLESCVELDPNNWLAQLDYVTILHKRQKFAKALEQAARLRDKFPDNQAFELALANESLAIGDFDTALDIYDKVIASHPELERVHLSKGHALKTIGRLTDGVVAYRAAYRVRADFGDAYWSLANLKTYRFSDEEIAQMRTQFERAETAPEDRFHLAFALGKAYEDRGEFGESFAYYETGNRLRKEGLRYDPERPRRAMCRQMEVCTKEFFEARAGMGRDYADPIFVVGLPRAGSTLIEQILASHSAIDGTMELPNIIATAHRLNGRRLIRDEPKYPGVLAELTAEQFDRFADAYIADTAIHRKGAPRFVDKMPNNFMHIGLIHLMLPNAKIIDVRRHPMACCFSGFKQLFADGQEFTYSLEDIAQYYKGYVELMDHWDRVLPGRVLRLHYEHVVEDAEREVARILDYLGLPFQDACMNFYRTGRSIRTPSSEQVRQPIYTAALEQWRKFAPYLGTLQSLLADEIEAYPPVPAAAPVKQVRQT